MSSDQTGPDLGTDQLLLERDGPIAWLTVNNPERRNALSMAMYRGLGKALRFVEADDTLEVLIVIGIDDVFISGGDIADHGDEHSDDDLPFEMMQRGTIPVVAAVNGHCLASGVLLAVLADVAVVSDQARFRLPELRLGIPTPWSSSLLPWVVGMATAKDLALTSRPFDAAEAKAIGLVSRVVPHDELRDHARRVALDLLEVGPQTRLEWKRAAHSLFPLVTDEAIAEAATTSEAQEGFAAFLERRPPAWSPRARDVAVESTGGG